MERKEPAWVGSVTTVAGELERDKLYLVGVQEVKWDQESTIRTGD